MTQNTIDNSIVNILKRSVKRCQHLRVFVFCIIFNTVRCSRIRPSIVAFEFVAVLPSSVMLFLHFEAKLCFVLRHLSAFGGQKVLALSKFLGRPQLLVEKRWPGLAPHTSLSLKIPLCIHNTHILWYIYFSTKSTLGGIASACNTDAASAAILIQMWNLAGPVTNRCDDV